MHIFVQEPSKRKRYMRIFYVKKYERQISLANTVLCTVQWLLWMGNLLKLLFILNRELLLPLLPLLARVH